MSREILFFTLFSYFSLVSVESQAKRERAREFWSMSIAGLPPSIKGGLLCVWEAPKDIIIEDPVRIMGVSALFIGV